MASTPLSSITWNSDQSDLNVSYHFIDAGITIDGNTAVAMDSFTRAQLQNLFTTVSTMTNLTFTQESTLADADFRIMLNGDLEAGTDGFMNPPGEDEAGLGVFSDTGEEHREIGGYHYMVMAHELLHGLGLAHPHDDGGSSTIMNGVTDAFDDFGAFDLNQGVYTAMTYNNGFPGEAPAPESQTYGYETGPMALDIAVLQAKYGANMTHATGNDTYRLDGENGVGTGWTSIWDAGGTDEITYDGDLDITINLRAANLEYKAGGGGWVSSADGIAGGFTIASGVTIENASGGAGDDVILGNYAANTLSGSAGDDALSGAGGDDMLTGGKGDDELKGGKGADMLNGQNGGDFLKGQTGADELRGGGGSDALMGNSGADFLSGGKGSDRLIGGGGNDNLQGDGAADFLSGGNGNDTLDGGRGRDMLTGGAGADTFVFAVAPQNDRITDFASGTDALDLTALGDITARIVELGNGYSVQLNTDNDGLFDDGAIFSNNLITQDDLVLA
ncbi:MAG: M10 family metallopeptidase C-terminal domain-containing protein [Sulfitobacter sp.]